MLVISDKGIYEISEKELEKYEMVTWISKKEEITQVFDTISKVIDDSRKMAGDLRIVPIR